MRLDRQLATAVLGLVHHSDANASVGKIPALQDAEIRVFPA
jgi:hypothetical protein